MVIENRFCCLPTEISALLPEKTDVTALEPFLLPVFIQQILECARPWAMPEDTGQEPQNKGGPSLASLPAILSGMTLLAPHLGLQVTLGHLGGKGPSRNVKLTLPAVLGVRKPQESCVCPRAWPAHL